MIKLFIHLCLFIGLYLNAQKIFAKEPLIIAFSELPPWKIINEGKFEGAYAELAKELAKVMNMKIEFRECPLMRCLKMMELGKADIIIGVQNVGNRKEFIQSIKIPIRMSPSKVFYLVKGTEHSIKEYEDLKNIKFIGTQRGSKYFSRFDNDTFLKKYDVTHDAQIFSMLLFGRVDSVIINEDQGEYLISMLGIRDKVEKAFYEYNDDTFRYIGISKKSVHLDKLPEFESAMQNIVESGKWDEIMNEYFFIKHGIPADAFRWK